MNLSTCAQRFNADLISGRLVTRTGRQERRGETPTLAGVEPSTGDDDVATPTTDKEYTMTPHNTGDALSGYGTRDDQCMTCLDGRCQCSGGQACGCASSCGCWCRP